MPRSIIAAALLATLGLFGCAHGPELRPAPGAQRVQGEDFAASTVMQGVRVVVDGDAWGGTPAQLRTVTPIKVRLENNSGRPLLVRFEDFSLVTPEGRELAALPPLKIEGTAMVQTPPDAEFAGGSGFAGTLEPGFGASRKPSAPGYDTVFPHLGPWDGPLAWSGVYDDTWYSAWPVELPTQDMVQKAIPEGVVSPGGQVDGFLYFQEAPEEAQQVAFQARLVDAQSGQRFGSVRIPFLVAR
jgi:hypothetical protein